MVAENNKSTNNKLATFQGYDKQVDKQNEGAGQLANNLIDKNNDGIIKNDEKGYLEYLKAEIEKERKSNIFTNKLTQEGLDSLLNNYNNTKIDEKDKIRLGPDGKPLSIRFMKR